MWAMGGEFIRELNYDPPLRKKPVEQVLLKMIEYGGPLLYHGGEDEQRSFDATCRKFKRFLNETAHRRSPSASRDSADEAELEGTTIRGTALRRTWILFKCQPL
jgi:hypothetical protein